jgi:hypothetical protein
MIAIRSLFAVRLDVFFDDAEFFVLRNLVTVERWETLQLGRFRIAAYKLCFGKRVATILCMKVSW